MENTKFTSINIATLKLRESGPVQVQARSHLYCLEHVYKQLPLFVWPHGDPVQMERVSGSI